MRLALVLWLWAGLAVAQPLETSLRPVARAVPEPVHSVQEVAFASRDAVAPEEAVSLHAVALSLRPWLRPPQVVERAMAKRQQRRRGAICGEIEIQGVEIGAVPGRISGCGVQDAVRVTSVSGVSLSQRAVMDCPTAQSLNRWVRKSAKPGLRRIGGGLQQLQVAAHYSCRTRNSQSGARISEHGKGRAIDISGFVMRDGSLITVEQGWTARATHRALRKLHRGACGPFGTVLGPEADRFHRDHFHFDTAQYRSGHFCR